MCFILYQEVFFKQEIIFWLIYILVNFFYFLGKDHKRV